MIRLSVVLCCLALLHCAAPIFEEEDQVSGLVNIDTGDQMFYWLFRSRNEPSSAPLIIWLQGGPGCASEMALFYENGPFFMQKDGSMIKNEHSWNNYANMLYVDQPLGTGFSTTTNESHYVRDETGVAENFYKFIHTFLYETFPEFQGRPLYITGESYGGHYIPAIADYILRDTNKDFAINLQGVAIGNGLTVPHLQFPSYADFAYSENLINTFHFLYTKAGYSVCSLLLKTGFLGVGRFVCDIFTNSIANKLSKYNPYDIRIKCESEPCDYDFSALEDFLNKEEVQNQLGVPKIKWEQCSEKIFNLMTRDIYVSMEKEMTNILNKGLRVLIYSGDKDYICNWKGGEDWVHYVDWSGKKEFNKKEYASWISKGTKAGLKKSHDNFTFLRIHNSGHMVPMDLPEISLQLIDDLTGMRLVNK